MLKSMTAYASADISMDKLSVSVEIRSYNNKYLDMVMRLPHAYNRIEDKIKGLVSEKVSRGRVELNMKIADLAEDAYEYEVNELKAQAYYKAINQLQEALHMNTEVPLRLLATSEGIIRPADNNKNLDKKWPVIQKCITKAIDELNRMRRKEGEFIEKDFEAKLRLLEKGIIDIEKKSDGLLEIYRERLTKRITTLTRNAVEIDPERIAQETAFLADKSDISEEIVRIKSHIDQFRKIMKEEETAGRKLNFLLQEFNREFNTIGSKTGKSEVSHMVVNLKSELEKIREQVQNIE